MSCECRLEWLDEGMLARSCSHKLCVAVCAHARVCLYVIELFCTHGYGEGMAKGMAKQLPNRNWTHFKPNQPVPTLTRRWYMPAPGHVLAWCVRATLSSGSNSGRVAKMRERVAQLKRWISYLLSKLNVWWHKSVRGSFNWKHGSHNCLGNSMFNSREPWEGRSTENMDLTIA